MATAPRARFAAMVDGSPDEWAVIARQNRAFNRGLPDRVLDHLRSLARDDGGFAVDRLVHCLQAAHRAEQAGRSDEYVLCALLHDIGDNLGSFNHQDVAAAIVRPFVSDELHWMVAHHGEFQGYFFFHHLGLDRDAREAYRGHAHFAVTEEFCAEFDQCSFDAGYPTPPLEHFEPLVRGLMARPARSLYTGTA